MVIEYEHRTHGTLKTIGQPILFDGERNQPSSPPPLHGEHTASILADLGYSQADIARLEHEKTVFAHAPAPAVG